MIDYDKDLTTYILDQLNAVDSDLNFEGGYIFYVDPNGALSTLKQNETNKYVLNETNSIPVSFLGYAGEQQPIPNVDQVKYTIPIQIYVETHKVDKITTAIKTFRENIKDLTPVIDGLKTVFNSTPIDASGGLIIQAGKQLVPINFTIFTNATSGNLIYLNTSTIKIKKTSGTFQQLKALSSIIQLATNTDDFQGFTGFSSKGVELGAVWSVQVSTYLDQDNVLEKEILEEILKGESNQEYTLEINVGKITFEKVVNVFNANNPIEIGVPTIHTITFKEKL